MTRGSKSARYEKGFNTEFIIEQRCAHFGSRFQSNYDEVVDSFDDMSLREELLRGIYAYGFERPSAIQQRAILPCVKGQDVIAQAQSGES